MKNITYASSREITNAFADERDGEPLTERQQEILDAAMRDTLRVHDEARPSECQYVGGGYMQDSRGNYRECFVR